MHLEVGAIPVFSRLLKQAVSYLVNSVKPMQTPPPLTSMEQLLYLLRKINSRESVTQTFFILEFAIEINKERVEYILAKTGVMRNPHRKDWNIYYQRDIIRCGLPNDYAESLWQNHHYLRQAIMKTRELSTSK